MTLYIPHSIFHLARLLYVRPETFGPYYVEHLKSVEISYTSFVISFQFVLPIYFLNKCHRLTISDRINAFLIWPPPALHLPTTKYSLKSSNLNCSTARYISFPPDRPLLVVCISQLPLTSYGRQHHFHPAGAPRSDEKDSGLIKLRRTWRKLRIVILLYGPKGTTNVTPGSHKTSYREVFLHMRNPERTQSLRLKRNLAHWTFLPDGMVSFIRRGRPT